METIKILEVDCNNCAAHVKKALDGLKGIDRIDICLDDKIALVTFNSDQITKQEISDKVEDFGYEVE